jgi:hypothetical protein
MAATVAVVVTRNAPVRSSREPTSPATVVKSIAPPAYRKARPVPWRSAARARWRAASSGSETRVAARCDRGASHPSMTTPSKTPSAPNPNPTTTKSTSRPPARWPHAAAAAHPGATIRLCRPFYGATRHGCSLPEHMEEGPPRRMSPLPSAFVWFRPRIAPASDSLERSRRGRRLD